jgi:glycosyltransferase involved in cell wall biosynthesis
MKNKLSVTIITKNEEKNIGRCLASVQWADEIIVVDSGSTDLTLNVCKLYKCKIIQTKWQGFGKTKQFAVNSTSNDWVLSIDADEEISPKLKDTIQNILENTDKKAYKIKRTSFYIGKEVKHCGWNKDFPLRLFHKKFAEFNDKSVHESVKTKEKIGIIYDVILHYSFPTLKKHLEKMIRYSELGAESLFQKGRKSSIGNAVFRGIFKFIKMYFLQAGYLDGKTGLLISFVSGFGVSYKYFRLWELNNASK